MNYYNEIDPFAAAWLRELIKADYIPQGEVDERSIADVRPSDLAGYTQCHFFAGIGGWSLALQLAKWPSSKPVWTGSCPCQPFSAAGKETGITDERHLWPDWFHLIQSAKPFEVPIFGEQVDSKGGQKWLDIVFDDLQAVGYSVWPFVLPAACVGAPHARHRLYFVADTDSGHKFRRDCSVQMGRIAVQGTSTEDGLTARTQWTTEPRPTALADGVSNRMEQCRAYGNAVVPQAAQAFIEAYMEL